MAERFEGQYARVVQATALEMRRVTFQPGIFHVEKNMHGVWVRQWCWRTLEDANTRAQDLERQGKHYASLEHHLEFFWDTDLTQDRREKIEIWYNSLSGEHRAFVEDLMQDAKDRQYDEVKDMIAM